MSVLLDAADALVTVLNTASDDSTLSQTFTATRKYVPRAKLADLSTLHVTVAPATTRGMIVNRGLSKQQFFTFEIGVQQRATGADPDDDAADVYDPLVDLVEEIDTLLVAQTLTVGALKLIGSTHIGGEENGQGEPRATCNPELIVDKRLFESVSTFSFKVVT